MTTRIRFQQRLVKWMRRVENWLSRRKKFPLQEPRHTGFKFISDQSTTKAVARRMALMEYYLRGEDPPVRTLPELVHDLRKEVV